MSAPPQPPAPPAAPPATPTATATQAAPPGNPTPAPTTGGHWLARSLGLALPVIQAPMAGSQDHRLSAAVAQAGGLGSLPAAMLTPEALAAELQAHRNLCSGPVQVNFFCHTPPPDPGAAAHAAWEALLRPWYHRWKLPDGPMPRGAGRQPFDDACADVVAQHRPEVVSFHFGLPEPRLLQRVRDSGARIVSSATTVAEARWLAERGVDAIVAQGWEAGGHRGHFLHDDLSAHTGLLALLPQLVQAVNVPVIAAGGVATPQAVAAVQRLGAQAVQVGTAYLLCPQATPRAVHRAALLQATQQGHAHTAVTRLFSGRPARGLMNRLMDELGPMNPAAPPFPLATAALAPLREAAEAAGQPDCSPLWAGQAVALCRPMDAGDLTRHLASGWA